MCFAMSMIYGCFAGWLKVLFGIGIGYWDWDWVLGLMMVMVMMMFVECCRQARRGFKQLLSENTSQPEETASSAFRPVVSRHRVRGEAQRADARCLARSVPKYVLPPPPAAVAAVAAVRAYGVHRMPGVAGMGGYGALATGLDGAWRLLASGGSGLPMGMQGGMGYHIGGAPNAQPWIGSISTAHGQPYGVHGAAV